MMILLSINISLNWNLELELVTVNYSVGFILMIQWEKFLLFSVNSNNFICVSVVYRLTPLSLCLRLLSRRFPHFLPLTLHLSLCALDWLHLGLHILSTFRSPLLHIRLRSAHRPWAITVSLKGGWGDTGLINQSNFLSLCQREGDGSRWILSLAREYPRVHLFQMVAESVYAEAARRVQQ